MTILRRWQRLVVRPLRITIPLDVLDPGKVIGNLILECAVPSPYGMLGVSMAYLDGHENKEKEARSWGQRLAAAVQRVLEKHPHADPDNVRHTLILMQLPPIERLRRSLIRGRYSAQRK